MPLTIDQLSGVWIVCKAGTFGGVTYYIGGPEPGFRPTCFRRIRGEGSGNHFCSRRAGQYTPNIDLDEGACKFHGGANSGGISTGRYSKVTKRRLRRLYEEFGADEENLMDLKPELILQRTLLAEAIKLFQDNGSYKAFDNATALLRDIARTIELIEKIENNKVLTQATLVLIMTMAMDVFAEFVQPGRLREFRDAWHAKVASKYPALAPPLD